MSSAVPLLAAAFTSSDAFGLVAVLVLIAFSAFLGLAETSLTRVSSIRMMARADDGAAGAKRVLRLIDQPARFLNVILLVTLVVQFGAATITTSVMERLFGNFMITVATIILTIVTFIFAESMPKTFAIQHPERVAMAVAPVVAGLTFMFYPLARVMVAISNVILPGKGFPEGAFVSEREIRTMVDSASATEVEAEERKMIHSIFEFGDTVVREVMTPRPDMIAVDIATTLEEVMRVIVEEGYSRIPVYKGDNDSIVGLIYAKDVLRRIHENGESVAAEEIARQAHFVPEQKKVAELLREMQEQKYHMAIVVDEHGGTAGIVTLEDLLEEIVGEIVDEYDVEEPYLVTLTGDSVRARGGLSIDDLNEELGLDLPSDEWDTVGGLVLNIAGQVPEEGDVISFGGLEFRIERVVERRILSVVITGLESLREAEAAAEASG